VTRVPDDPVRLLELARAVATEAAALISDGRQRGLESVSTKSSATDMVTEYDRASEQLIVERIRDARPDDGILGEEGSNSAGSSGIDWLIDPIDGTTNFLYGLAGYAVSVAARDGDGGLIGVVAIPALGEIFTARRGAGAFCNDAPIHCSDETDLARALIATGFSYLAANRRRQARRLAALIEHIRDIRRVGAAAGDLCYAAAGRVDAYFEEHLNPWDLAAGEVIAVEAGCRTGSLDGGPLVPASTLVAPPALFGPLSELIAGIDSTL
jgi:myo-inositol-1(or 4)-monophosphatase